MKHGPPPPRARSTASRADVAHGPHVVAVHAEGRDLERLGALADLSGRDLLPGRELPVEVVLADVDDRQPEHLGEVEALVEVALVGGAVAEERDRHAVDALERQRGARWPRRCCRRRCRSSRSGGARGRSRSSSRRGRRRRPSRARAARRAGPGAPRRVPARARARGRCRPRGPAARAPSRPRWPRPPDLSTGGSCRGRDPAGRATARCPRSGGSAACDGRARVPPRGPEARRSWRPAPPVTSRPPGRPRP